MADNHGNTPAAWTAVTVAMLGFVVASVALMMPPINMVIFWIGAGLAIVSLPLFIIMGKMGYNGSSH